MVRPIDSGLMAETGNMAYSKIRQPKLSDVI
ncbi:GntR family transcriptional regulator, partial [Acinetobacter baumannii]|nr:GntR family transcriptional regulator [Acinetobacter baumannii]